MGLKAELQSEVSTIFRSTWTERAGQVVPDDESVTLGNDAVKLTATVLYADLADSTTMVDKNTPHTQQRFTRHFCIAQRRSSEVWTELLRLMTGTALWQFMSATVRTRAP